VVQVGAATQRPLWRSPLLRILVSAVILAAMLAFLPFDTMWQAVRGVPLSLWLGALALFLLAHAVGAYKWGLLIAAGGSRLSYRTLVRCYFAGLFSNLFLPSVAGGDVVRAGLAIRASGSGSAVVLGSVVDRLLDSFVLLLLVGVGWLASPELPFSLAGGRGFVALAVGAVGLIAAVALLRLPLPGFVPRAIVTLRARIREAVDRMLREPRAAIGALLLSVGIQSTFVGANVLLARACGIELDASIWFVVWPLAKLSAMLPLTFAGLGVREAALAALLGRFDIPAALSVAQGLIWQSIVFGGGLVAGLFWAASRRLGARPEEFEGVASVE